jgi:hypothetical protein
VTQDLVQELKGLERRWQHLGANIAEVAAPGLAGDVVVAALADIGLPPDDDVLAWFAWHNGAIQRSRSDPCPTMCGLGLQLASIEQCMETTQMMRRFVRDEEPDIAAVVWPLTAFSVAYGEGLHLVIDMADAPRRPARLDERSTPPASRNIYAENLARAVAKWNSEIDRGDYGFDSERQCWLPNC